MLAKPSRTRPTTPPTKALAEMTKGRMPVLACGPFLLPLLLVACGGDRSVPSSEQNDQLNNAAEMLDQAPNALEGIDETALDSRPANQAGPRGEGPR